MAGVSGARAATYCLVGMAVALPASAADERIGSVGNVYDGVLPLDIEVNTFRHIDHVFPSATVKHGGLAYPLPAAAHPLHDVPFESGGQQLHLDDYMRLNRVAGLLVLKNGAIEMEQYRFGNTPQTRWVSFSVVKSITSTLAAAAVQDGFIATLDDPVAKYLPELRSGGYARASVRNVLQMASGVRWNEAYTDPSSDRRKLLDLQSGQKPGALLRFMGTLPKEAEPGTRWNYNTGETYVLGALVRAAVRQPLSQYLSAKIWSTFGMENDATWWTESRNGIEFGGSGFAATLRDYARFGQFVLNGGRAGGKQVVPPAWFPDAGQPKKIGAQQVPYGYMWWSEPDGAFRAFGIFGQSIYINPKEHVVVVVWSAQAKPTGSALVSDNAFFQGVLRALRKESP